jgi:hypothetical protein
MFYADARRPPDSATSPKGQLERATADDIVRPMKSLQLDRTEFRRSNIADSPDLAVGLSIRQRMLHLLKRDAMTKEEIAEAIEERIGVSPDVRVRKEKVSG